MKQFAELVPSRGIQEELWGVLTQRCSQGRHISSPWASGSSKPTKQQGSSSPRSSGSCCQGSSWRALM
ncbi:hypothetical protein CLOM_g23641 [Closterium sp. NIES-68]|nr:hypothetical protein CLOM_g23641 [Closterium sp. NIES-68]GJP70768.1 hypothetical protein CLOP_g1673 [Closterium sp. NIES-67]